ncbi:MAG: hypothetical protein ACREWG_07025 [Gammaproteobacteria bacterium]
MLTGLARLRLDLVHSLLFAAYPLLALGGYLAGNRTGAALCLGLLSLAGLLAAMLAYERFRIVADTPTSKIRHAAQGYVELFGKSTVHAGQAAIGFTHGPPCLWYRYALAWSDWLFVAARGRTDETFVLIDPTGSCVIDPEGAEVYTTRRRRWLDGSDWVHIEYLAPGDTLYALGEFVTAGSVTLANEKGAELSALLKLWKQDPESLHARFDRNGDGHLDPEEWAQARRAAEEEIEREGPDAASEVGILHKPRDGRLFLLSNQRPYLLAQRYRYWSWFHLALSASAGIAALAVGLP